MKKQTNKQKEQPEVVVVIDDNDGGRWSRFKENAGENLIDEEKIGFILINLAI